MPHLGRTRAWRARVRAIQPGDTLLLLLIVAALGVGARAAYHAPETIHGPALSLSLWALPSYALLSLGRMSVAYGLALLFSLSYTSIAARNLSARRLLMPLLDILQSVPILSFLPIVLLSLNAVVPSPVAFACLNFRLPQLASYGTA
jgi:NitT/TauT family transport system permease protein